MLSIVKYILKIYYNYLIITSTNPLLPLLTQNRAKDIHENGESSLGNQTFCAKIYQKSFIINKFLVSSPCSLHPLPLLLTYCLSLFASRLRQSPLDTRWVLSFLISTHPTTNTTIFFAHSYNSLNFPITSQKRVIYYMTEVSLKSSSAFLNQFWVIIGLNPEMSDWEGRQLELTYKHTTFNLVSI